MKRPLLAGALVILCAASFNAKAGDDEKKNTIEIQGKGLANSTFLFNKNISDAGNNQDYAAGWGYNYGLGFSMYFGNVGFGIDGLIGNHQGAYAGSIDMKDSTGAVTGTKSYTSHINLSVTQIPLMFKLKSEVGGYLEIGPQYNMISAAKYSYADDNSKMDTIVTKNYASSYFSVVLGFGFKIPVAKSHFSILGGLRLQYSLSDLKGVDALGRDFMNPFVYKDGPQSTSAATGGLMLGVVYTLGEKKKDK